MAETSPAGMPSAARSRRPSTSACRPSTSSTRPRTRPTSSASTPTRRGFEIVRTYADEGKSGLRIDGRDALQAADRRRPERPRRLQGDPRLRRQPLGPLPGRRRERLLRVHLQARRHRRPLLRRAVRERRQPGVDHHQEREARDGRRVQPRAVGQGLQGPVPADRTRLSARAAPAGYGLRRMLIDQTGRAEGRARARRAEEPADRPRHPRARARTTRSTVVRRIYRHVHRRGRTRSARSPPT